MEFIERLDYLIERQDTTRQAVAEYVGLSKSTISEWVRTGAYPRADIAIKISEYLKTSVEYLITGKEPDNTQVINELRSRLKDFEVNINKLI